MEYIRANSGKWPTSVLCRIMRVSQSGYYRYLRRPPKTDHHAVLLAQIYEILKEEPENANYGTRRIYQALVINKGYRGSYSTVWRVCKENNLMIRKRRRPNGLTKADRAAQKSENLIKQDFTASVPNTKWLTDITEIPCADGKLYLAPVLDCFDGKIVGFSMADNMRAELCRDAFTMACKKEGAHGMLLHSDRGSQFTSALFRGILKDYGAIQSMSSTGCCFDNARMESWFATLKKEKLYKMNTKKMSMEEVQTIVFYYICYYNLRRIYSTNGGYPPEVYRQMFNIELFEAA
jgi:transposase InsO family protein